MHKGKTKKSCEREIRGGQAHHKKDEYLLPIAIIKVAILFWGQPISKSLSSLFWPKFLQPLKFSPQLNYSPKMRDRYQD